MKEYLKLFDFQQTADTLELPTGNVKLSLQFADGMHASYGSKMSHTVKVFIK